MRVFLFLCSVLGLARCQWIDCIPGKDEAACVKLGCVWNPTQDESPDCTLPANYGYRAISDFYAVEKGQAVDLERVDTLSMFGGDFDKVTVVFHEMSDDMLRIKIAPSDEDRYEVPITLKGSDEPPTNAKYAYSFTNDPVFSFKVTRKSDSVVIFDSSPGGLTVADQFLQLAVKLDSSNVYGFGEQEQPSLRHDMNWKTWGMFARDHAPEGNANLYGVHPFYINLEQSGKSHGVLFLNSNAQEVTLMPAPGLVYRTIGGILDIYIFMGDKAEDVVSQYTLAIDRFQPPPYWALGFHLCRWGYNSLTNMKAAWQRTLDAGIPFDAQWGDIDYMDRTLDFTINPTKFSDLPAFVDELHEIGMKFVPILDPCISQGEPEGTYPAFEEGNAADVWVKDAKGNPLVANVWPVDNCYFPDFFQQKTEEWWSNQLARLHDTIKYDGIWIDMNEPANFVKGTVDGCDENRWNNPPYKPQTDGGDSLLEKTICMDATQEAGLHYDVHSMYGWSEARATNRALREITGKRPFILSRSTFVGSGKYTAHWLGDNFSEWDNMHYSIIGMLQYNMFGIPLVGADVCGFIGNTTEELCARWHQLGAFYPFTRNHNLEGSIDQDPGFWGRDSLVARVARETLKVKYGLLPYFYSAFYNSYIQGGTVARPVWHEFSQDSKTHDIDTQFMIGEAVMVSPILEQGATQRSTYLPPADNDGGEVIWYDPFSLEVLAGQIQVESDLKDPNSVAPFHIRGGHIIPAQEGDVKNTAQQRESKSMILLAYLNTYEEASGHLYLDDGESENLNLYTKISFQAAPGVMEFDVEVNNYDDAQNWFFEFVRVIGVAGPINQVSINGAPTDLFNYYPDLNILDILPQSTSITDIQIISWSA